MKTAAIYCRVSTEDQEREGTSLQTQLENCLTYCQAKGYEVVYRYSEAYSGLSLERPELDKLRGMVQDDRIDVVVVYSLDRFTRDPVHGVILLQECEKHGVKLEAVTDTVDNSETGKLIYYIKGYAAKLDAERRKDATGRGKKALLRQGKLPQGTGIGIYGYQWDGKSKKRILIELEAKVVEKIFTMVAESKSVFVVARELNRQGIPTKGSKPDRILSWHPLTVKRIIKNQAYVGKTYFGTTHRTSKAATTAIPQDQWTLLPDVTPAIISQELFDRANSELVKPKLRPGRAMQDYLLKSHVFCPKCGRPLIGAWLSRKYRYYQCSGARPTASRGKVCDAKYVRADWLEQTTWDKIKDILQNPDVILEQVKREMQTAQEGGNLEAIDTEVVIIERRLRSYPGQKRRLLQAFKINGFEKDDILDELNQLQQDKDRDLKRHSELKQSRATLVSLAQVEVKLTALCKNSSYNTENCSAQDKKQAFDMLDIKVYASSDRLDIKGVIPEEFVTIEQTSA